MVALLVEARKHFVIPQSWLEEKFLNFGAQCTLERMAAVGEHMAVERMAAAEEHMAVERMAAVEDTEERMELAFR